MNQNVKPIVLWAILFAVAALVWAVVRHPAPPLKKATYSQFLSQIESGVVLQATINNAHSGANPVEYRLHDGTRLESVLPGDYRDALAAMQQKLVDIEITDEPQWPRFIANSSPFLILLGVWFFAYGTLRQRDAGSGSRPGPA